MPSSLIRMGKFWTSSSDPLIIPVLIPFEERIGRNLRILVVCNGSRVQSEIHENGTIPIHSINQGRSPSYPGSDTTIFGVCPTQHVQYVLEYNTGISQTPYRPTSLLVQWLKATAQRDKFVPPPQCERGRTYVAFNYPFISDYTP